MNFERFLKTSYILNDAKLQSEFDKTLLLLLSETSGEFVSTGIHIYAFNKGTIFYYDKVNGVLFYAFDYVLKYLIKHKQVGKKIEPKVVRFFETLINVDVKTVHRLNWSEFTFFILK